MWQPSSDIITLKKRASIIKKIRSFFEQRDYLEVQTPLLSAFANTDPHIESFAVTNAGYLVTSPEFHMKRLLAAGSGPIFQINAAFRQEEIGHKHNQEFSLLEWYHPGWDHQQLIQEVYALVCVVLGDKPLTLMSYQSAFKRYLTVDPFTASLQQLYTKARSYLTEIPNDLSRDELLDLLCACVLEPALPKDEYVFITDYPSSQAALAKKLTSSHCKGLAVAARFELYCQGMELANGYWELTDAHEQARRFEQDNQQRQRMGKAALPIDTALLAALNHGMPESAGVALGLDRLLMLALGKSHIKQVMAFTSEQA